MNGLENWGSWRPPSFCRRKQWRYYERTTLIGHYGGGNFSEPGMKDLGTYRAWMLPSPFFILLYFIKYSLFICGSSEGS